MNPWYDLTAKLDTAERPLEDAALERIESAAKNRLPKRRSRMRIALAAAAILLMTACSVAAVKYADWFGSVAQNPLEPTASEDVLASMGTVIDQSQTADGITVNLHGALWDGRVLLLSLSVDGEAVPEDYFGEINAEGSWVGWSKEQTEVFLRAGGKFSEEDISAYLQDYDAIMADIDPARIRGMYNPATKETDLVVTGEMGSKDPETELTLYLEDLWGAGPFRFDFAVTQNRAQMVYTGQTEVKLRHGMVGTVTKVLLTPLRVEVTLHGEQGLPQELEIEELRTDQQVYASRKGATIQDNGDGTWNAVLTYGPLERVMDPAQVTGVYLGDNLLELNRLTLEQ